MKKIVSYIVGFLFFASAGVAMGAPVLEYRRTILPETTNTYDLGSSLKQWLTGYFGTICLSGDCKSAWPTGGGGSGGGAWATNTAQTLTYLTSQWTALIGGTATTSTSSLEVQGNKGITSYGVINAPYFTATSTTVNSVLPLLSVTNSTTTNATSTSFFSALLRSTTGYFTSLFLPSLATPSGSFLAVDDNGQITSTTSPTGTPSGADTQVQFNDGGTFAGEVGFEYLKSPISQLFAPEIRSSVYADPTGVSSINPTASSLNFTANNGLYNFAQNGGGGNAIFDISSLTVGRNILVPDKDGTLAMLSDITNASSTLLGDSNTFTGSNTIQFLTSIRSTSTNATTTSFFSSILRATEATTTYLAITGGAGTQECLRRLSNGAVVGTGSDCGSGGAVSWGAISGTLSAQTDLQSALDLKLSTSSMNGFDKGYFFSTTSADYWDTTKGRWSSTSQAYWASLNDFATTSVNYWYTLQSKASSTLLSDNNTFSGQNIFDNILRSTSTNATTTYLNVSGNATSTFGGGIRATCFSTDGTNCITSGAGGTPAGSNMQIQYNNGGVFGASADFSWDNTNKILNIATSADQTSRIYTGGHFIMNIGGDGQPFDVNTNGGLTSGSSGGNITLTSGFGSTTGMGGSVSFIAGSGSQDINGSGNGGDIFFAAGRGGLLSGNNGRIVFSDPSSLFNASLLTNAITADRSFTFPDATGTFCLTTTCSAFTYLFNNLTNWSTTTSATGTSIQLTGTAGFYASGTSHFSDITFSNATGTQATTSSFAITSIISKLLKTGADGSVQGATAGTDYENPLTFSNGVSRSVNAISLATINAGVLGAVANGTIPTSLATSSLYLGTAGQVLTQTANGWVGVSTTTFSNPLVFSAGNVTCTSASSGVTGCLTGTDWNTFNGKQNSLTATFPQVLTGSTLSFGGLTTSTPAVIGNLAYFSGANTFANVSTTTASCTGSASCSPFTIIGNTPITINATGGSGTYSFYTLSTPYGSAQATNTLMALENGALFPYFIATSTTATSTIFGNLKISSTSPNALVVGDEYGTQNFTVNTASSSGPLLEVEQATNTISLFNIQQSGFVGISTSSPWAKLSIVGDTNSPLLALSTSTNMFGQMMIVTATTSTMIGSVVGSDIGVRFAIGTTTVRGFSPLDQMTINGRINSSWRYSGCDIFNSQIAQLAGDTASVCGEFIFVEDTAAVADIGVSQTGSGDIYARIRTGTAGTASAASDGGGISWLTAFIGTATNTPVMEVTARKAVLNNATSSLAEIGFANYTGVSADYATIPTNGCYFEASSTAANWWFVSANGSTRTYSNTGVASSTSVTGTGQFQKFRIELGTNSCVGYIATGGGQYTKITNTTNVPTIVPLNPVASIADVGVAGLAKELHIRTIRVWLRGVDDMVANGL